MKFFQYCCAILAVVYLIAGLLPANLIAPQNTVIESGPAWLGRTIAITDFALLVTMFYGLHARKPIYWGLIPLLLALYLLSILIPSLWTLIELSLPWQPFVFVMVFFFVGMFVFYAWWRKQRSYFA